MMSSFSHTSEMDTYLLMENESRNEKSSRDSVLVGNAPTLKNQLGTFLGVFLPCCLSIFGIILFLRLSWVVAQAGLGQTLGMIFLAYGVDFLTVCSVSAIATNGKMKGGGAYYMISRCLGPEFGGAIGVILYLANVTAVAMYLLGGSEFLVTTFGLQLVPSTRWNSFLLGIIFLLLLSIIAFAGASLFAKSALFLFILLVISIVCGFISLLFAPSSTPGYLGFSSENFQNNLEPAYTSSYSFPVVFAIFFPAVTGIMSGANMSGDLKDSAKSIPRGTFGAVALSLFVYVALVIIMAGCGDRTKLLNENYFFMQEASFQIWVYIPGEFCSLYASALASIVGAARVLQALCRDDLLPGIHFFSVGSAKGDEPRRAVALTIGLVTAFMLMGNLNSIAPLNTMCFLLTYSILNLACFVLSITGAPNFRPVFKFFNWWLALSGFVLAVVVMFVVSPIYAGIALALLLVIMILIHYRAPATGWGTISQALIYHQVRKYLLRLDRRKEHVKFWRPSLLLLVANPRQSMNLVHVCNHLKKGGLYIIGNVLLGNFRDSFGECKRQQRVLQELMTLHQLKAFPETVAARSVRDGAQTLLMTSGLGGMRPNTLVIGFFDPDVQPREVFSFASTSEAREFLVDNAPRRVSQLSLFSSNSQRLLFDRDILLSGIRPIRSVDGRPSDMNLVEYVSLLHDAMMLDRNILIARNFDMLSHNQITSSVDHSGCCSNLPTMTIDVWPLASAYGSPEEDVQFYDDAPARGTVNHKSSANRINVLAVMSRRRKKDTDFSSGDLDRSLIGPSNISRDEEDPFGEDIASPEPAVPSASDASLTVMLAFVLHQVSFWSSNTKLRLCSFVHSVSQVEEERKRMETLLSDIRINAEIVVSVIEDDIEGFSREYPGCSSIFELSMLDRNRILNRLMYQRAYDLPGGKQRAAMTFVTIDSPPDPEREYREVVMDIARHRRLNDESISNMSTVDLYENLSEELSVRLQEAEESKVRIASEYMNALSALSSSLPPTMMTFSQTCVISKSI